ncbi:MAG: hypothetical protein ACXV49_07020 [Halobacteriota archaeon]
MRLNRTLKERGTKIVYDVVFVDLMIAALVVLCVFKPRYIGLIVRGYIRAVRRKHERHIPDEHHI